MFEELKGQLEDIWRDRHCFQEHGHTRGGPDVVETDICHLMTDVSHRMWRRSYLTQKVQIVSSLLQPVFLSVYGPCDPA